MTTRSNRGGGAQHDLRDVWDNVNGLRQRIDDMERQLTRATSELEHSTRAARDMATRFDAMATTMNNVVAELRTLQATRAPAPGEAIRAWVGPVTNIIGVVALTIGGILYLARNDNEVERRGPASGYEREADAPRRNRG